MNRRTLAIDAGLAGLVFGLTLAMLGARGFGTADPDTRGDDGLSVLLAMASALPLALRRTAPLAVYVSTSAASLSLVALDYGLDLPLGPMVATYSMAAAYGDDRGGQRWVAMAATSGFVPLAAVAAAASGADVSRIIAPELLFLALFFACAWIAGDRARLRQAHIAELEERARRREQEAERERRLAAAEERTRIARELHDSAGHAINVILVEAGAARLLHDRDPARSRQAVATIEEVARNTITEIDRLVHALRSDEPAEPPVPADPAALDDLLQHHRTTGLELTAELEVAHRALPRSVAWAAYRILQEALTNATRHGAGRADVAVRHTANAIEITVTNPTNGSAASPGRGGHGIVGMQERATLLGGTLDARLSNGSFRLHAWLPYGAQS